MSDKHHKYQYVVICRGCGIQPLKRDQYLDQLNNPNSTWRCPHCGGQAQWDDNSLETDPGPPDYHLTQLVTKAKQAGAFTNEVLHAMADLGDLSIKEIEGTLESLEAYWKELNPDGPST